MPSTTTAPLARMLDLPAALFLIKRLTAGTITGGEACAAASNWAREARIVETRPEPQGEPFPGQLDLDALLAEVDAVAAEDAR